MPLPSSFTTCMVCIEQVLTEIINGKISALPHHDQADNMNKNNKNNSLEEILARKDYIRMTEQLKEKVEYIAHRICDKMFDLDIEESLSVDGVTIRPTSVCSNVGGYLFLAILNNDYVMGHSLEDIGKGYYYGGDFTAWVQGASNKEALSFLHAAKDIILKLGEIEQKQAEDIRQAIDENDNITEF